MADIKNIELREHVRHVLVAIQKGRLLHEQSWDAKHSRYAKTDVNCFTEAVGGDEDLGYLLHLFNYWENDVESIGEADYGVKPQPA